MRIPNSPLGDLLQARPDLHPQRYFKSSLTALSHAMEDLALTGVDQPLVIANFQQERFYRQEIKRYWEIAQHTDQVYVLAAAESDFAAAEANYEIISFQHSDRLANEWHLVVLGQEYAACIVCQEHLIPDAPPLIDQARQFEGIWTFDRQVSCQVAQLLLAQILFYRPDLARKVEQALRYNLTNSRAIAVSNRNQTSIDTGTFTECLVRHLQANQNQLLKAYATIASQERQARLANSITAAIRRSLNLSEILSTAVAELGQAFRQCRCLLYRCDRIYQTATIEYEAVPPGMSALKGETWLLVENPLFQAAVATEKVIAVTDITKANLRNNQALKKQLQRSGIRSWLLVPIMYQETLLGMLEIHATGTEPYTWQAQDISLVEAIAAQVGVALIQAQAYSRLEELNSQLAALEQTRTNLIAIVGHELRTPLSTIQICLESLADEPQMPLETQQIMLQTALTDAERLRKLTEDFLTLSRLETGQVHWQFEPISLQECLNLALNNLKSEWSLASLSQIEIHLSPQLPLILCDGEGLVQVLLKLIDNALKFTSQGKITIGARIVAPVTSQQTSSLEVYVADTGRGIELSQLKAIFSRFSQEEGYLRRLTSGTGLGLAICHQIIQGLGGRIWAESSGKNQGSQFYFTLPLSC